MVNDDDVVIVSYARTPIGRFGGSLKDVRSPHLAAEAIKAALNRGNIEPKLVDEVVMGSTLQGGMGQNLSRYAALLAGLPKEVGAYTVNRVCSSGMQAIFEAYRELKVGDAAMMVAGGVDSMSTQPLAISSEHRWGVKHLINRKMEFMDLMINDGLLDPTNGMIMGQEADAVAKKHEVPREELDEYAYISHTRAVKAVNEGLFKEVEPFDAKIGSSRILLERDEGIRPDTSLDKLKSLKPAFGPDGLHTAGNSSQLSDGAAALVLTTRAKARELGLKPIARITGYSWAMLEPWRFPEAPIYAINKLLEKTRTSIADYDAFEINEAFAVVNVLINKILGVPYEKMDIFGGAIALGHPLGASGARIVTTLITALHQVGGRRGLAALCHGTGGGTAISIEVE